MAKNIFLAMGVICLILGGFMIFFTKKYLKMTSDVWKDRNPNSFAKKFCRVIGGVYMILGVIVIFFSRAL